MTDLESIGPGNEIVEPPKAYFLVQTIPDGEAPEHIRAQWTGIALPVRYDRKIEAPDPTWGFEVLSDQMVYLPDSVTLIPEDCIEALRCADRHEAADWWVNNQSDKNNTHILFNVRDGILISPKDKDHFYPDI